MEKQRHYQPVNWFKKMLKVMELEKKRVGKENYYNCIESFGHLHVNKVKSRQEALKIYYTLRKIPDEETKQE